MPSDRLSTTSSHKPSIQGARLQRRAPTYMGHSLASRRVQAQIHRELHGNSAVLLVGAEGTGKRTIAEILHHFGGGEVPALQVVELQALALQRLEFGPIADFAYLSPLEALSLEQQSRLIDELGLARAIFGTRLNPDSSEGRKRLSRKLLRWCGARIQLPSLSERIEDLETLALAIIRETPARRPIGGLSDAALECLCAHHWPGNVSELEAVLHQAIAAGTTEQIELHDLAADLRLRDLDTLAAQVRPDEQFALAHAERSAVKRAMRHARGNKRKAARLLQVGKTTLYRKLREYALGD